MVADGDTGEFSTATTIALLVVALTAALGIIYGLTWTATRLVSDIAVSSMDAWIHWGIISLVVAFIPFAATVGYYRVDDGFFDTDEILKGLWYGGTALGVMVMLKLLLGTFSWWIWAGMGGGVSAAVFIATTLHFRIVDGYFDTDEVGKAVIYGIAAFIGSFILKWLFGMLFAA